MNNLREIRNHVIADVQQHSLNYLKPPFTRRGIFMSYNEKKNYSDERKEMKTNSSIKEAEEKVLNREPSHVQGHRTSVIQRKEGDYMCPECSKTFDNKDRAEEHLHSEHFEHLRLVHEEFHSQDKNRQHQK